ncbi:MAG: type II toxin-antitoxin system HipA family toxin [Muribaculaceae bacterium]|nr:type II toxin-antitoxin system HipA family toxin [Muribaculaceae bacterium]
MIDNINVILWDRKVGSLVTSKTGYRTQVCFYFSPDYVKSGLDFSPLRASLSGVAAQKGLPIYPEEGKEFGGLPSFIADSMPDHWGNVVFAEWAKANNIHAKDLSALDRLAYIGRRGMGALEFVPPISCDMEKSFKVEIAELSRLVRMAIDEAKSFHAVMSPDFIIESLFRVGTSAGGRRPKAVINVNPETGECYSGQVPTKIPGFVPMIIKFDEHMDTPTTRIEYSYYLMGVAAGLRVMPSRLVEGDTEAHFMTERFDRKGNEKIHIQTLAAMAPLSSSYEDLFDTAQKLSIVPDEMNQLFLQMVLNVISGNVDDHNKNFSFMMDRDGKWHISPAYDYTFAVDVHAPFYVNRHSMTINEKNHNITGSDLQSIAERYDIKGASGIIDKAVKSVGNYREYALQAGVTEPWIGMIENEVKNRIKQALNP